MNGVGTSKLYLVGITCSLWGVVKLKFNASFETQLTIAIPRGHKNHNFNWFSNLIHRFGGLLKSIEYLEQFVITINLRVLTHLV